MISETFDSNQLQDTKTYNLNQLQDSQTINSNNLQDSCISVGAAGDVASQTRSDKSCSPNNPNSLTVSVNNKPQKSFIERRECNFALSRDSSARNPITGMGLNGDGVGGWKPLKPKCRRGDK